jgi:hypothetical protein
MIFRITEPQQIILYFIVLSYIRLILYDQVTTAVRKIAAELPLAPPTSAYKQNPLSLKPRTDQREGTEWQRIGEVTYALTFVTAPSLA